MNHNPKPRCPKCKGTMKRTGAPLNPTFTCKRCGCEIEAMVGWSK